jgi:AcrR family transcriptional regulator
MPERIAKPSAKPSRNGKPLSKSGVAAKRREQVIEAAIDIIATQGIHKLSLGNIEKRVKMTRGHLTYYFRTKDAILLAVLDRMVERMIAEKLSGGGPKPMTGRAWDCIRHALADALQPPGPDSLAFLSLIHTFHAQMSYQPHVRKKIAKLNQEWRADVAKDYAMSVKKPPVPPEVAASIMMALLIGIGGQVAVDPHAFDRKPMMATLTKLLAPLFAGGA